MKHPSHANTTEDLKKILKLIQFVKSCINFGWKWEIEELKTLTPAKSPITKSKSKICAEEGLKGWLVNTTFRRPDINTGKIGRGAGRQIYIGRGASTSGIFFSCVVCVKLIVEHEWMEAIRFDGKRVLNPHHTLDELSIPDLLKANGATPELLPVLLNGGKTIFRNEEYIKTLRKKKLSNPKQRV